MFVFVKNSFDRFVTFVYIYIYSREIMNSTVKRSVKEHRGKEQG